MNDANFGFYFEKSGRSASQGAVSPAEQFFEGSLAESSLVRETAQNSIDARAGQEPVRMVFELAEMSTQLIPGVDGLRSHLEQVEAQTRGTQGYESMATALRTARQESIPVLRISDFGTKGLTGSESMHDPTSPLSALTRGAGISADDGSRGGSFGIGSAVGPMASNMSTVLYTSQPIDRKETIFAGYSCLASHRDTDNAWRGGDGFYTDLNIENDFRYLRDPSALGPFPERTESGTDVFILGYRKADADPDLQHIKVAFMRNFLAAIDRGGLIVEGITPKHKWRLDQDSLKDHIVEDAESQAFYRAIKDPEPILHMSRRLGKLALYINIDDGLEKTLHTITMRKPLMRIDTFRHNSIPVKYAAVLECSDDRGNKLLRTLEPPQHHKWDAGRASYGESLLRELKNFVRDGLKSRVKQQIGDQVQIKGLSRYLPTEMFEEKSGLLGSSGTPEAGEGTDREASTVHGSDEEARQVPAGPRKSVPIGVRTPAVGDGDSETDKGKDQGGPGKRRDKGGPLPGTGEAGEGNGRITAGDVRFRSWSDASTGDLCLAVTAANDVAGDLELVPLGPGGSVEESYTLPIAEGVLTTGGTTVPLTLHGNVLSGLELKAGITSQVRLKLSSTHRYRLGVK